MHSRPGRSATDARRRRRARVPRSQRFTAVVPRLAIARAVLGNPAILLLDEATSALDAEAEEAVQQGLKQAMAHRTVLVIAHRLATVQEADQILVLEGGRIVERGSHNQLMAHGGRYRELCERQLIHMGA